MGRKASPSPQGARWASFAFNRAEPARWPFSARDTVVAVAAISMLAVVGISVIRETTTVAPPPSQALSRPDATQPPTLMRAEEAYVQALWPIHGAVERTSARVSLGNIFYKTNDLGKADLKARVDAALAIYQQAEAQISALEPPPSFAKAHAEYLKAVRLFEQSALEEVKMFEDGNEDHLLASYSLRQEATNKIRVVGIRFWRDEYPPN
jgi:hypothetical protein